MPEHRKKLIEVALPLDAINRESAREKSIRHGHPSTLHLWWARRPLAACRAVLFTSLVDDPSTVPEEFPTEEAQDQERQRLFRLIEELVKWENSTNDAILHRARLDIARSVARSLGKKLPPTVSPQEVDQFLAEEAPPVLDPFCGGGSIPLEAQRLGLRAVAGDLNPVAVLITKALIEIPPKFAGHPPVNPEARAKIGNSDGWRVAQALAEDVRYYGRWMRDEAEKRIGHLYPKVKLPKEYGGGEATVIAWLWARTVGCPNPACGVQMPLVRSFWLCTKKGKKAWVKPVVNKGAKTVQFEVKTGMGGPVDGTVNRRGTRCIVCDIPASFDHVRAEGKAGRMSTQLMAIVAEGERGRVYLPPKDDHKLIATDATPKDVPDTDLPDQALGFRVQLYGMAKHRDLFTPRQLLALTTFSDLVSEARERVLADALKAGAPDDSTPVHAGGTGATAYSDAVATYLGFAVSRVSDYCSTICTWASNPQMEIIRGTFARQALPMTWDFAEANVFGPSTGSLDILLAWIVKVLDRLPAKGTAAVKQANATTSIEDIREPVFATDPPYYDNIGYADLSDFFYVWLRCSLSTVWPDLFRTVLTPKTEELVATPYRFGGSKEGAKRHFEEGLLKAFGRLRDRAHPLYPVSIYYAFKQAEEDENQENGKDEPPAIVSTGWETMLESLCRSRFVVHGTWPMRTERTGRSVSLGTNALASSIVLACRPRPQDVPLATRREFLAALQKELPGALNQLQRGNIAPVDLAQAAIGPGMAVFSRYSKVLEADGNPMSVRTALALINQALDEYLTQQEGEMDADTRWALAWFEQSGGEEGPFGVAETLSKAKNTAVNALEQVGILRARGGKVRLVGRNELADNWDPAADERLTVWKAAQHLIRQLEKNGEAAAAALLHQLGGLGEEVRALAYRLFTICDRKGWAQEALAYNMLVVAWPRLLELASARRPAQAKLFP